MRIKEKLTTSELSRYCAYPVEFKQGVAHMCNHDRPKKKERRAGRREARRAVKRGDW